VYPALQLMADIARAAGGTRRPWGRKTEGALRGVGARLRSSSGNSSNRNAEGLDDKESPASFPETSEAVDGEASNAALKADGEDRAPHSEAMRRQELAGRRAKQLVPVCLQLVKRLTGIEGAGGKVD
jgi:hypothetical protein